MPSLSRFDWAVLTTLSALALLTGLLVSAGRCAWRGDQAGVGVVSLGPTPDSTGVSTRAAICVAFGQEMLTDPPPVLALSPPVSGTLRWSEQTLVFQPAVPLAPDTTYTATLGAGLQSRQGHSLRQPLTWQFRTGHLRVLYLAPDAHGHDQLFVIDPAGGAPTPLTEEPQGVYDHALSSDGTTIAYVARRQDAGSDLWTLGTDDARARRCLLSCPEGVECSEPAWHPDGQRLVYTRRESAAASRLWWLDAATGETTPVFQDEQALGNGARWSPDGQWLSYVSPLELGVRVYNVNDGRTRLIPAMTGEPAVWSPGSDALLVTSLQVQGEAFGVQLLRVDLISGEVISLSGGAELDDGWPAWSPDGSWIAFARKAARVFMGRQLWLVRPSGSEARPLTGEPEIHYGPPAWSPDGRYLLFYRAPLDEASGPPGVWLLEVETKSQREIITPGYRPVWLP